MRAYQIINSDEATVELKTVDLALPGPGEVLVKNHVSAISPGTERAFCLGLPGTPRRWPSPIGYSQVGEVLAAGPGVDLPEGVRVHSLQGHASAVLAKADTVTAIPDGVNSDHAAFLTMLEIALQGVRKAQIQIGEDVLVFGGGIIGQFAAQLAHVAGAGRVLLADISPARLAIATKCGVAHPVDPREENGRRAIEAAGRGGGPEVIIEATGAPAPILDAFKFAGRMGRVVLLGSTRGEAEKVDFYRDVHRRGLTVIGAHNSIRPKADDSPGLWTVRSDAVAALRLLESGRLNLGPVITDQFDAMDFKSAYSRMFRWDEGMVGCVLRWGKDST